MKAHPQSGVERYRGVCDCLDQRLLRVDFETRLISAEGAIGDIALSAQVMALAQLDLLID